jgi:transposase InsO family protein
MNYSLLSGQQIWKGISRRARYWATGDLLGVWLSAAIAQRFQSAFIGRRTARPQGRQWRRVHVQGHVQMAYENGVEIDFSRPGKPTDNEQCESFNGRFRQECLNSH